MATRNEDIFPFAAIVGQDELKRALLMAAIDPTLGGVLAFGDRGTGKTTAIRALAALLPDIEVRSGCPYNSEPDKPVDVCRVCNPMDGHKAPETIWIKAPVIDLPLGATEDRVCGALDLERALAAGEKAFEPGLLANAHRGFLYIDEVNLLEDHIVDLLLDVAASGWNVVEREGLSVRHPARFVLVGSGNPEEGELRPQLLDRFGISITVSSPKTVKERVEVVKRRDLFERDPKALHAKWARANRSIRDSVLSARARLADVEMPDEVLEKISELCLKLGVDGLRGELTLMRATRVVAAMNARDLVDQQDIIDTAPMALAHRLRRDPLDDAGSTVRVERALASLFGQRDEATSALPEHNASQVTKTYGHA
ncbi:MAG: magnesium chelatase ATPase subunit I [Pseudomonadota bacterium]